MHYRADFMRGKHDYRRREAEFRGERLLDASENAAAHAARHREDDVAAVEQRAHITESKTLEEDSEIGHGNDASSDNVDAAQQRDLSRCHEATR